MSKAIVLLSGGMDSATMLAMARAEGKECHALSFDYGQRHGIELVAAKRAAEALGAASHLTLTLDTDLFSGSPYALLSAGNNVPAMCFPATYVPGRNTLFLAHALARAEVTGADQILLGANAHDRSYPDCRPEFVGAFNDLTRPRGVEVLAPLIGLTKTEIIRRGLELDVDYALTHSCFDPNQDGTACGACEPCVLCQRAFGELGMEDPRQ